MATYAEPIRSYEAVQSDNGPLSYENITLTSGAGSLVAGSVLGKKTVVQAAAPIPAVAGGTGNGTMTLLTFGPDVQVGSYVIQCITAVAHGGVFSVTAPDGTALPNFSMGTTTGGTARYTSSHISFSLTDNADFITANSFTVVVTAAGTPAIVGTGQGVMSAITLGKYAQLGTYRVKVVSTSATSALEVTAPDGSRLKDGVIGAAYTSDHVNFSVADGGTMTAGDYYNIVVANQSAVTGLYSLCDPTAVDGTQNPAAVLVQAADASSTTATALALVRLGEIKTTNLTWKTGISAAQKTALLNQLKTTKLIVARS